VRNKNMLYTGIIGLVLSVMFFASVENVYAWGPGDGPDHRGGFGGGEMREQSHREFIHGRDHFWFEGGRFYRRSFWGGLVLVAPPIGLIVDILPSGYSTIIVDGNTYYYYEDVYYTNGPSGYIVVERPVRVTQPVVVKEVVTTKKVVTNTPDVQSIVVVPIDANAGEAVTINIPGSNGSFIPVKLVKSANGYTGPQGEYYPGRPTVAQLKVLYDK
jgi:hypothetical protein